MDAAPGTKDVPVSRQTLTRIALYPVFILLLALIAAPPARAEAPTPMHWSGDQTVWDRRNDIVTLTGHAAVHQPGESLTADKIVLNLEERTLHAKGHCVYISSDSVIHGEEMDFNLDTRTGTILGGRVSSGRFMLTGERINKLGPTRFQTHRGEYTTCLDCPHSWTLRSDDVDMEFEGYAFMTNVTAKIKDAPVFWLPYLIVPLKTHRQTGLLPPRFGAADGGLRAVLPFYLAINRSSDMTFGAGAYGSRGLRLEWEGRYKLSDTSGATANFYYLHDKSFLPRKSRFALGLTQSQDLPEGVQEKLRINEVSDNFYPYTFPDIGGQNEAYLASDLIFSHSTDQVSAYVAGRRFRNLLNLQSKVEFDPNTVQVFPTAAVTTNDKFLLQNPMNVVGGVTLGITNFSRTAGAFDQNPFPRPTGEPFNCTGFPCPGFDPIREATRVSVTPSVYSTQRLFDRFSLIPSFEYRAYFYSFHHEIPDLIRGYGLIRADLSTQLERVYSTDDPEIPRIKHLIRPMLSYSLIPFVNQSKDHPFIEQMDYAREHGFSGFNFDNYDIVPIDSSPTYANYFTPLGHSLSYGLTTDLIRRRGRLDSPSPSYQRMLEFSAGQTYDFRQLRRKSIGEPPQPFSRLFSNLSLDLDHLSASVDYFYQPYIPIGPKQRRHVLSGSLSYIMERGIRQDILAFDRSLTLSYYYNKLDPNANSDNLTSTLNFSLNDYILPSGSISYDLLSKRLMNAGVGVKLQSPSRCYSVQLSLSGSLCPEKPNQFCITNPVFNIQLNLTGQGFGGVSELTSAASGG